MKKVRKPILVDSSIHTAFGIKYTIYALFGLLGATAGSSTLERVAGDNLAALIATIIFLFSTVAAVASFRSVNHGERWEKVELYSTIGVASFISVYCTSAVVLLMQGDDSRMSLALIAAALLVFPVWRVIQIIKKLRKNDTP